MERGQGYGTCVLRPQLISLTAILFTILVGCSPVTAPVNLTFPALNERTTEPAQGKPRLRAITTIFGGQIPVFVGPSARPQVLQLASFESTVWHIYLFPRAKVTKIYLSGFDPQRVVIHRSRLDWFSRRPKIVDLGSNPWKHPALSVLGTPPILPGSTKEAAYRSELKTITGLDLTDFHGREYIRPDEAIAVSMRSLPVDSLIRAHFPRALLRKIQPADADLEVVREDIVALIARGDIPDRLPLYDNVDNLRPEEIEFWSLLSDASPTRALPSDDDCGVIQLGSAGDDTLWCDKGPWSEGRTHWIVAGPGTDIVRDNHHNSQVISGGPGNDIITADLGSDVIYFGSGWGEDVVAIRCMADTAAYRQAMPPEPRYMNSRYIVFGRDVRPADLVWISANEIEDRRSRSRIRFVDEPCATFLAVEPGVVPLPPVQ